MNELLYSTARWPNESVIQKTQTIDIYKWAWKDKKWKEGNKINEDERIEDEEIVHEIE